MSFLDNTPNNQSPDSAIVSNDAVVLALLHIDKAQSNLAAQRASKYIYTNSTDHNYDCHLTEHLALVEQRDSGNAEQ